MINIAIKMVEWEKNISLDFEKISSKIDFESKIVLVPIQNNSDDCGIAVIENIEQVILKGDDFFFEKNQYDS